MMSEEKVIVKVEKIDSGVKDAKIPKYFSEEAAGFDLYTCERVRIPAKSTKLISTGLRMEIPKGFEIQIRPRSGLSLDTKLRIANSPGTIDSDYRGEIKIIVENTGSESIKLNKHTRIAQGVIKRVPRAEFLEVKSIDETERNSGGFGSTGGM